MTAQSQPEQTNGLALRVFLTALAAGILGALITLPLGENRQLSIEAWLAVVSVLLAFAGAARLLKAAPVQAAPSVPLLRRQRDQAIREPRLPGNLVPVQGLLLSARDSEKAFTHRLQPRLIRLADHYLRTNHGAAGLHRKDQVMEILGDSAWLIDPAAADRTPTITEIDNLLERLLSERTMTQGTMTEEPMTQGTATDDR